MFKKVNMLEPILICGPTASGKSKLAMNLANEFGAIIINADALQIYDSWRILTARPNLSDEKKDELYQTALEIIKSEGKASTSFLQRKLQIGYNRAARIIDMMESEGIVSKANHVGKREVLK